MRTLQTPRRRAKKAALVVATLLSPFLAGCGTTELQDRYGQRSGPDAFASVNGTAVFADMCDERGHTVFSWPLLSPRLQERADCIVWFPDDFSPPNRDARNWLERWLRAKPNRTLIYVGRHFDALPWYWEHVPVQSLPANDRKEVARRRKTTRTEFAGRIKTQPKSEDCEWFAVMGQYRHRPIASVEGDSQWTQGIDPKRLDMELNTRFVPPPSAHVLFGSQGDAIVFRRNVRQSQMIVVANGSFLLNAPLTNREHRRLAGRLIDEIGPAPKTIAFLETGSGGPRIDDTDPTFGPQLGFEVFHIWPTNWILLHVCLAGVLLCFWRFPIFGRPADPVAETTSDFGTHIDAVARLLARSGDLAFAHSRLHHYRQTVRPEGGSAVSVTNAEEPSTDASEQAENLHTKAPATDP